MQGIVTRLVRQALAFVTVLGTAAGCVASHAPSVSPPARLRLTLLDTVVIATEPSPPGGRREAWIGSLSGLARDARTARYLAVVDDRQLARVAWLDIAVEAGRLLVRPGEVVPILAAPGIDARLTANADLESIVALPDGTWVASEEGHDTTGEPGQPPAGLWPPALLTLQPDFTVTAGAAMAAAVHARSGVGWRPRQPGLRGPDAHTGRAPDRRTRTATLLGPAGLASKRSSVQRRPRRSEPPG